MEKLISLNFSRSASSLIPNEKGSLNIDIGFADILANHLLEFQVNC